MALRSEILRGALPLIPTHSFARPALTASLRAIKPEVQDAETVIDTIFGSGPAGPKALVGFWEDEAMRHWGDRDRGEQSLDEVLRRRLEHSAGVGEHLVEAYAQLTVPSSTPTLPLPLPTIPRPVLSALSSLRLPPAYTPPGTPTPTASSPSSSSSVLTSINDFLGRSHQIPLLRVNPLGPLGYAWRIADQALYVSRRPTAGTVLKRGYWNEPVGAGPEWYAHRIALSLAYLSAESHLLQAYPSTNGSTANPHLPSALTSLTRNLSRYREFIRSSESAEQGLGEAMSFVEFVGKSWQGLIKSRYW